MRARYCLTVMLVAQLLSGMAIAWALDDLPDEHLVLIAILLPWALFALAMWLLAGDRLSQLTEDWRWPDAVAWSAVLRIAPLVLLAVFGLGVELAWFGAHYWEWLYRRVTEDVLGPPGDGLVSQLLWGMTLMVFAPLLEECFFRGILLRRWQAKWGAFPALLLTSGLFGVLHPAILPQVVLGMICGVLLIRSGSIWPAIVLHALNNLFASVVELAWPAAPSMELLDDLHPYAFAAALTGLSGLVIWLVRVMPEVRAVAPLEVFRFPARVDDAELQPELPSAP